MYCPCFAHLASSAIMSLQHPREMHRLRAAAGIACQRRMSFLPLKTMILKLALHIKKKNFLPGFQHVQAHNKQNPGAAIGPNAVSFTMAMPAA